MKVGSKAYYGFLALVELASNYKIRRTTQVKEIAKDQDIPSEYLGQIMVLAQSRAAGPWLARSGRRLHFGAAAGDDHGQRSHRSLGRAVRRASKCVRGKKAALARWRPSV